MKRTKIILCSLVFSFISSQGLSQVYFEETFFPVYVSKNDALNDAGGSLGQDVPTESGIGFDTRTTIGYIWKGIILALTYNYFKVDTSRKLTSDFEGKETTTGKQEWGPTLGYYLGNWRLTATYFLSADKNFSQSFTDITSGAVTVDETYKNTSGSGFQLAVGYDFGIGAGFTISPTLIYRTVSYSKQSYDVKVGSSLSYAESTLQTKAIDNELKPMITLSVKF